MRCFLKKSNRRTYIDIINSSKDGTTTGLEKESVKILKRISKFVVDPLVYNSIILQSIFPNTLKIADVKPLLKINLILTNIGQ